MNEAIRQALADAGEVDIDAPNEVIGAAVLSTDDSNDGAGPKPATPYGNRSVGFEDLRARINAVQLRADDQVYRCRARVEYLARYVIRQVECRTDDKIGVDDTGASLGQIGEGQLAKAARELDLARAQAAAVRNVWLAMFARFGDA